MYLPCLSQSIWELFGIFNSCHAKLQSYHPVSFKTMSLFACLKEVTDPDRPAKWQLPSDSGTSIAPRHVIQACKHGQGLGI